jgi:hypothetical protein
LIAPCSTDIFGNADCPPGYPTYVIWDSSARNGSRVKFYYSVGADFCVTIQYLPSNQIRFVIEIGFVIAAMAESAFALQRRYRRREFYCNTTVPISTTVYNDGALSVPAPLAPCTDPLTEWLLACDPYTPPTPPDPCNSSTSTTVTETGCSRLIGGVCVDVADSASLVTDSSLACCDGNNSGCEPTFELQRNVLIYVSDVFDCDSVPAEIELTLNNPEAVLSYSLEWDCLAGWTNTTPETVFTIPTVLTLTVT